jgi:hypothetical protein
MCGATAIALAVVALSSAASSPAYSGPWDAAHLPATITVPGVIAQAGTSEAFEVRIGAALSCPNGEPVPITVTFSDPSGAESASLAEPCGGRWAEAASDERVDFSLRTFAAASGVLEPSVTFISAVTTPFVYEVSNAGGVIARGALIATVIPPRVIDSRHDMSEYVAVCVDGKQELQALGRGDHYCEVGGGTNYTPGDWPAPAPSKPAAPAPRKPRYPALTLATAPYWTEIAVEYHFGYHSAPPRYHSSACAVKAAGRFSCDASWQSGAYSFAGAVKVGAANVYTGRYRYTMRIVRTNLRTHQRRTFVTG